MSQRARFTHLILGPILVLGLFVSLRAEAQMRNSCADAGTNLLTTSDRAEADRLIAAWKNLVPDVPSIDGAFMRQFEQSLESLSATLGPVENVYLKVDRACDFHSSQADSALAKMKKPLRQFDVRYSLHFKSQTLNDRARGSALASLKLRARLVTGNCAEPLSCPARLFIDDVELSNTRVQPTGGISSAGGE